MNDSIEEREQRLNLLEANILLLLNEVNDLRKITADQHERIDKLGGNLLVSYAFETKVKGMIASALEAADQHERIDKLGGNLLVSYAFETKVKGMIASALEAEVSSIYMLIKQALLEEVLS